MADPALYVVVRNGRQEFRLDRAGARSLPARLLDGPDAWAEPSGRIATEPYDEGWATAGVLFDCDRRIVRWYNRLSVADDSIALRRALLPLLARYWPGWTVEHADRGYVDVVDRPDLRDPDPTPPEPVTVADLIAGAQTPHSVMRQPMSLDEYLAQADPFDPFVPGYGLAVLTVRDVDGRVSDYIGATALSRALVTGPDLLTMHREVPTAPVPGEFYVNAGAVIDVGSRTVAAWQSRSGRHVESAGVAERWPGWRSSLHRDGLPGHMRRSGRDDAPVRMPWQTVLAEACFLFTDDAQLAEEDHRMLLLTGSRYRGWPGLTGAPLEVLQALIQ